MFWHSLNSSVADMEGIEDKLGSILNNPQLMQQIMSMAQSLGTQQNSSTETIQPELSAAHADFDPTIIAKVMSLTQHLGADPQQQALLHALTPYISPRRVEKLEKAMRAVKLANAASAAFSSGGLSFLAGR